MIPETASSPDFEALCAEVHSLYQAEIKRQGREERHNDDYYALPEHVKELDRVFVRWHVNRLRPYMHVAKVARQHDMALPAVLARLEGSGWGGVAYSLRLWRDSLTLALGAIPINAGEIVKRSQEAE